MPDVYASPLVERYASREMAELFSATTRVRTWRRLWVALADAQRKLGLPISAAQVASLKRNVDKIDFKAAARWEKRTRHDVMAHIHAFGEQCPKARGVIHLGATSMYVVDNADLLIQRQALRRVRRGVVNLVDALARFAGREAARPCVAYTHFQPAQFTTVGRRACLWLADLLLDLDEIDARLASLKFLGVKGAVGTQASFLKLFDGDEGKVERLERLVAREFGFEGTYEVTGQTYSRKIDAQILSALAGVALSVHKMTNDLRLLAHLGEVLEPMGDEQVGSTAMAYKRNPVLAERSASLARLVVGFAQTGAWTAATQWMERTLDDSAAKRVAMPEAFLAADGMLDTAIFVARGLETRPRAIESNVGRRLAAMATEDVIMEGVKRGGDRQALHEIVRRASHGDLWPLLRQSLKWLPERPEDFVSPSRFAGRAVSQTRDFLKRRVAPVLKANRAELGLKVSVDV